MKQPLVYPLEDQDDKELQELITFYNETLGFCPNSVKTMFRRPAIAYAFINMNKAVTKPVVNTVKRTQLEQLSGMMQHKKN
jgi:hypothetical protein